MSTPASIPVQGQDCPETVLTPGTRIRWHGDVHLVTAVQGTLVHLQCETNPARSAVALLMAVVGADDFAVLQDQSQALPQQRVPDLSVLDLLSPAQMKQLRDWRWHLVELRDGVPPDAPEGATPRPAYDPGVSERQRFKAKAAELSAIGWKSVSASTVRRRFRAFLDQGLAGLAPLVVGRPRTDDRVVELLLQEVRGSAGESSGWANRVHERLHAALRKQYPSEYDDLKISLSTFYRLLNRLGISINRLHGDVQARLDDANSPLGPFTPTWAQRLGEQVQIDSTGLDILAVGDDGQVVSVELTCAIDVASRSIIGAMIVPKTPGVGNRGRRVGGRATRSFDATLMLAQALAPMPGRPGWSPQALARASDLPYADLVACDPRMVGAAARPAIRPKMVVVDHGKIFHSEHFVDVCESLGISVRPARERTPTDKAIVESTFSAIKKQFCQYVSGYTGSGLGKRGKHVRQQPLWSINQLQDLLDEWIALRWQQTPHHGLRSPFLPGMVLTPNQMYAALVACEGQVPRPLTPEENRKLLPSEYRIVTGSGVRIGNRNYNSDDLQKFNQLPSGLKGQGRKWQIRFNPYCPRYVWLYDHRDDTWAEAKFVDDDLIGREWTQYVWEVATQQHLERGGTKDQQRSIALAVAKLLESARQGPADQPPPDRNGRRPRPEKPFTGPELILRSPDKDPYADVTIPDASTIPAARSLNVPAQHLFPGYRPGPLPSPPLEPVPVAASSGESNPPAPPADTDPARPAAPARQRLRLGGSAADLFLNLRSGPAPASAPSSVTEPDTEPSATPPTSEESV